MWVNTIEYNQKFFVVQVSNHVQAAKFDFLNKGVQRELYRLH